MQVEEVNHIPNGADKYLQEREIGSREGADAARITIQGISVFCCTHESQVA